MVRLIYALLLMYRGDYDEPEWDPSLDESTLGEEETEEEEQIRGRRRGASRR